MCVRAENHVFKMFSVNSLCLVIFELMENASGTLEISNTFVKTNSMLYMNMNENSGFV